MAILKAQISESNVPQGALCFIKHNTKPYKTGWYRKLRLLPTTEMSVDKVAYILERPVHKSYFSKSSEELSRTEQGFCRIAVKSISCAPNKYEIMYIAYGVSALNISNMENSLPTLQYMNTQKYDMYTSEFLALCNEYYSQNVYVELAASIIRL